MSLTFGYDLKDNDKILEATTQLSNILRPLSTPGRGALINLLPSWVPYLSYEPLAKIGRTLSERTKNEPMDFVRSALVCGHYARVFTLIEVACHSIMARQCIHWRPSIYKS